MITPPSIPYLAIDPAGTIKMPGPGTAGELRYKCHIRLPPGLVEGQSVTLILPAIVMGVDAEGFLQVKGAGDARVEVADA